MGSAAGNGGNRSREAVPSYKLGEQGEPCHPICSSNNWTICGSGHGDKRDHPFRRAGLQILIMERIYIRLLDEGTEVFRPTEAEPLGQGRFKVLPTADYDPEEEHWEFTPGNEVLGVTKTLEGEAVLVAVGSNYD